MESQPEGPVVVTAAYRNDSLAPVVLVTIRLWLGGVHPFTCDVNAREAGRAANPTGAEE
jgi:hypothetical protein